MRAELLQALNTINEGMVLLRAGNPNHKGAGPGGGQFTSSGTGSTKTGSHGRHWAKRQRRKVKAKREARQMRRKHKAERKNLLADQRYEWNRTQRSHKREVASHRKQAQNERTKLLSKQSGERSGYLKGFKEDRAEAKLQGVAGIKKGLADLRGEQKTARSELVASHAKRLEGLKADHVKELAELKGEHREYRQDVRADQKAEKRLFIKELRESKGHESRHIPSARIDSGFFEANRDRMGLAGKSKAKRFGKHRTHKASSAEAILRHVLRQRGWTKLYGENGLTGKQHINLLDDVRQYGRMHMRHEAETLFDQYGVEVDESSIRSVGISTSEPQRNEPNDQGSGARLGITLDGAIYQASIQEMAQDEQGEVAERAAYNGERLFLDRGLAQRAAGAIRRLFDRARLFLKELTVAGAMALKGNEPLTNAELYALDRQTKKQYEYLDKFEREVVSNPPREIADLSSVIIIAGPPPMTPGQFIARAESYGNSVWEVQNVGREVARRSEVFSAERRVHAKPPGHHECRTCIEQSARGWQPVGTLLEIGDSECMGNCDCYFLWQAPGGKVHVSPWGRHNPKGYEQPAIPVLPSIPSPAIPALPSGPGPAEKLKPKKIKLKPVPKVGERYPLGGEFPPARPDPTIQEILDKAGSPHPVDYYEEL